MLPGCAIFSAIMRCGRARGCASPTAACAKASCANCGGGASDEADRFGARRAARAGEQNAAGARVSSNAGWSASSTIPMSRRQRRRAIARAPPSSSWSWT